MIRIPGVLIALATLPFVFPVEAGRIIRLNDSASPQQIIHVDLEWHGSQQIFELREDEFHRMVGESRNIEVRLNTSPYIGKLANIYLHVPQFVRGLDGDNGLRMSWVSRGNFEDGSVSQNQRGLLFSGIINQAEMSDFLSFSIEVDSRNILGPVYLEMIYEIELL